MDEVSKVMFFLIEYLVCVFISVFIEKDILKKFLFKVFYIKYLEKEIIEWEVCYYFY